MFTSLSHDMRTPLNAITNSLQLIGFTIEEMKRKTSKFKDIDETLKPLYPRFERYIKIGDISSCLLLNLVEDILDLAKINAKMFKLNINPFKLGILLDEINHIFRFQWVERNLDFRIICNPALFEYSFVSDDKRIKQVLINLASNSIKFTERGVISISVSQFDSNGDHFLKFKVRDTGIGISKNDIPKLFK